MSSRKRRLFDELMVEFRSSQTATDRFDQAVADTLGLNRTDLRCIDIIEGEGPITAGRLAERTGLTSGAVTTVIDRLEAAGYARRVRDTGDRRRVFVEATDETRRLGDRFYKEHAALGESFYSRYSEAQIELLLTVTREGREFNERKAAELEAELARKRAAGS
ncbi:MAG TPA: MarR family transcriptional regulator [Gaiellaceae bacterium]|nr:MarR family transcriptional regulator [Gaiellaceae bacterium]